MTQWPDDWFRDNPQQAGAGQPIQGAEPPTTPPRPVVAGAQAGAARAEPTVQLPARPAGPGPAAPLENTAAAQDQLTRPGLAPTYQAVSAAAGWQASSGGPGADLPGSPSGAPSGWPEQPAVRTTGRPPRGPLAAGQSPFGGGRGSGGLPPGITRSAGWRRWLRPRRIVAVLAVVLSVLIIGTVSTYFYMDSKLTRRNVLVDYSGRPAPGAGQNWLITGSDSRQGLTRKQERKLATGHDVSGKRSDTIMVLHMPAGGGRPVLVSLPRDSWVPIPGYGWNKINAAYSFGGPTLLAKTVQNVTGLHIDHYMGIGFGGFVHVVDAIGGVRICLKAPLADPAAGLHLHKGCQVLDGAQALGFVRTRHTFASQDLQRIQNQRLFLRALLRKLTSTGVLLNPFSSLPAASGVAGTLTVDKSTSLYQLLQVALALRNPITTTVPIGNSNYIAPNGEDALLWNRAAAIQLFNDLRTDHPVARSLITGSHQSG